MIDSQEGQLLYKVLERNKDFNESIKCRLCVVCQDILEDPHEALCHHIFCHPCLVKLCRENKPKCPLCRKPIHKRSLKRRADLTEDVLELKFLKLLIPHIEQKALKKFEKKGSVEEEEENPFDLPFITPSELEIDVFEQNSSKTLEKKRNSKEKEENLLDLQFKASAKENVAEQNALKTLGKKTNVKDKDPFDLPITSSEKGNKVIEPNSSKSLGKKRNLKEKEENLLDLPFTSEKEVIVVEQKASKTLDKRGNLKAKRKNPTDLPLTSTPAPKQNVVIEQNALKMVEKSGNQKDTEGSPLDLSFTSSQKAKVVTKVKSYAIKFEKPLDLSMKSKSQEKLSVFKEFEDDQFLHLFFDSAQQFTQMETPVPVPVSVHSDPSNKIINKPEDAKSKKLSLYEKEELAKIEKLDKSYFFDSDSDSNVEDDMMCSEDDAVLIEETNALEKSRKIEPLGESDDESDVSFLNPTPNN